MTAVTPEVPTAAAPGHGVDACPILTFHMLGTPRSPLSFPPATFRDGLRRLSAEGYRSIDLLEAAEIVRDGRPFPPRSLVLTFDDGLASVHEEALPLLVELGWSATVFVTSGTIGRHSREGWPAAGAAELRELLAAGISIGAHTVSHPDLTTSTAAAIVAELGDGKAQLEELLGVPVRSFAYPFGRYDARLRAAAEALFDCACTDVLGSARRGDDPWLLPRIDAWYLSRRGLLGRLGTRPLDAYLTFRRGPRAARRSVARRLR